MNNNNRELASVKIDNQTFDIIASHHAMERMEEREVDPYVVTGNVLALGPERIGQLQINNDEAIIIDEVNDVSVVVGVGEQRITIITVIAKSNVFVKNNTKIYNI